MDFKECFNLTTTTTTTAASIGVTTTATNPIYHECESLESESNSPAQQGTSNESLSAEAAASDSGINVVDDNESTCNLRKRLLRHETFIELTTILKKIHDIDIRLMEIEFISDDKDDEASEGIFVNDALRAERIVKRQLERVRLEAEKRNLLAQMDSIKSSYYCQLGSFQLVSPIRSGIRSSNLEYSSLSRKISSESDHPQSTSELEDDDDDANDNRFSHNVMEWAFRAKERLQEGRLASLSPWQSENPQQSFSKVVAPPTPTTPRARMPEEKGKTATTLHKSRVWKISTEDEEELQLSPFHADTPSSSSSHEPGREAVTEVSSSESLRNDAELNQMVARVVSDPVYDGPEDIEVPKSNKKLEQTQLSFDAECEMLKSLLRKSQVSSDDEYVGSVSAFYRREATSTTPPPPGFPGATAASPSTPLHIHAQEASGPPFDVGSPTPVAADPADKSDTLIVLPNDQSCSAAPPAEAFGKSGDYNTLASSQVQLFAGAPLFAFPARLSVSPGYGLSIYDDFRRNGQDVPTPVWGGPSSFCGYDEGNSGAMTPCPASDRSETTTPGRVAAECRCSSDAGSESGRSVASSVGRDADYTKGSWASVTKSAAGASVTKKVENTKVDVIAEQRLCRILEKFIEVFNCTYDEARSLLELMQAKYDLLTSTPMEVIINAARDLLKSAEEREKRKQAPISGAPSVTPLQHQPPPQQQQQSQQPLHSQNKEEELPWNYKTVMCNFHKDGTCRLGTKCMFAHSKVELREPFIPNGFCIAFVTKGVCKWGSSCNYIHDVPSASRRQTTSEKVKLIKGPVEVSSKPRVPVGLNFASSMPKTVASQSAVSNKVSTIATGTTSIGASASMGQRSSSPVASLSAPIDAAAESGAKCKTKNKKEKEEKEWSTVSRGAKPARAPEFRSPKAIVAAFQIDSLCVLCQDQVSQSNNRITLECGHSQFHRGCIKDWLRSRSPATCPVCKSVSTLDAEDTLADAASSSSKKKK